MALNKLSKADLKTIMDLNEICAHIAWNHGYKAGDEGAPEYNNPFTRVPVEQRTDMSYKLLELIDRALNA